MKKYTYFTFQFPKKTIIIVLIVVAIVAALQTSFNIKERCIRSIFGVSQGVTLEGVAIQHHLDHELKEFIDKAAKDKYHEPINARVDNVWKGIPGLNGISVDVEKTIAKAMSAKRNEQIQIQYKQWEPEIQLKDLGAVPVYRGNSDKKAMSLMINVAWGTEWIENILDILEENNVKATFFVAGNWVEKNHESLLKIHLAGHEIGSHAYTHRNMSTLSKAELAWEIDKTDELVKKVIPHAKINVFGPPSGDFNQLVVDVTNSKGKIHVLWTLDTVDWQKPASQVIIQRIVPKAENGALVLMHPTESTVEALKAMVPALLEKGYKLITVSELLSSERNDLVIGDSIGFP
ncbi:hypothetical protein BHU72_03550 [Desulfuribacillus stibiiarsenatis]|uniref:NodB homology domain-containing protein n=1 Tax=Desulfuribacillus stibiiarsenatis TaxID=1390249 RepID=A0A1E5L6T9_9FIRM|nr:polysaccharide deacetylase family protein [Desulfuribacillus stibiiarsenatis]OEH85865.1 hypothetical protein BHU72_03550 [Desulfuribacillus stibiiarsenatis]